MRPNTFKYHSAELVGDFLWVVTGYIVKPKERRASLSRGATDTMRKTFSISAREPPCAIETWSRHLRFLAAGIDLCTYIHSGMGFDWPLPKHHRQVEALLYFCHVWSQDDEAGNGSSLLKMDYWCWLAQLCPSEVDPLWFIIFIDDFFWS